MRTIAALLGLAGCLGSQNDNVLLVIIDDVGIDKIGAYGVDEQPPATPTIDGLIAEGVRFRNVWAYPSCSPARAALLTGRYARRYGVGVWIEPETDDWDLPADEVTIAEVLARRDSAWMGKWHLVRYRADAERDPIRQGFDAFAGSLANLGNQHRTEIAAPGYFHWEKVVDGELVVSDTYATTDTVDDAVRELTELRPPWLLVVSLNAPHAPLHDPPAALGGGGGLTSGPDRYGAMLGAADQELGRLLDAMTGEQRAHTNIIVVSDNGTPDFAIRPPLVPAEGKRSVYELGVRVPLVVAGPAVRTPGAVSDALVHVTDLFATIGELAGAATDSGTDSISLVPYLADPGRASLRATLFTEEFENGPPPTPCVECAVRDATHKLIRADGVEQLFALEDDLEGPELLADGVSAAEQGVVERLRAELVRMEQVPFAYAE